MKKQKFAVFFFTKKGRKVSSSSVEVKSIEEGRRKLASSLNKCAGAVLLAYQLDSDFSDIEPEPLVVAFVGEVPEEISDLQSYATEAE